jgi:hypothetical protein
MYSSSLRGLQLFNKLKNQPKQTRKNNKNHKQTKK